MATSAQEDHPLTEIPETTYWRLWEFGVFALSIEAALLLMMIANLVRDGVEAFAVLFRLAVIGIGGYLGKLLAASISIGIGNGQTVTGFPFPLVLVQNSQEYFTYMTTVAHIGNFVVWGLGAVLLLDIPYRIIDTWVSRRRGKKAFAEMYDRERGAERDHE